MLKLLVFAPCEKVIIAEDKTSSVITFLEVVNISISPEQVAELEPDTGVPFAWYVFSLWHKETDEDIGNYMQRIRLILPDNKIAVDVDSPFEITSQFRNARLHVRINGFPIPKISGDCKLKVFLRKADSQDDWQEVGEYPIIVQFTGQSLPQSEEATPSE
ncbi:MAG: hypothetical protein HY231_19985 [Acidobacteria bacterium]|nr:hypothetical protein [Acidobacteriota bacterium]